MVANAIDAVEGVQAANITLTQIDLVSIAALVSLRHAAREVNLTN